MTTRTQASASVALALLALNAAALAAPAHPDASRGAGGSGHSPALTGTITSIDTAAGTITVTPASGTASVIALTSSTEIVGHETIAASAIALGDTLEVAGIPLTLQATSILDNHLSSPTPTGGTTGTTPSGGGSTPGTSAAPVSGTLRVMGVVTALSPPVIEVDSSFSIALSVTSSTTFAEVLPLTAAQLTAGETVRAVVVKGSTGTLTAVRLDVTPAS